MHVVARFLEWDLVNPVDRVDAGIAGVAELAQPLACAPGAGIVARQSKDIAARHIVHPVADIGTRQHGVVRRIVHQALDIALDPVIPADVPRRAGHDLQNAACASARHD